MGVAEGAGTSVLASALSLLAMASQLVLPPCASPAALRRLLADGRGTYSRAYAPWDTRPQSPPFPRLFTAPPARDATLPRAAAGFLPAAAMLAARRAGGTAGMQPWMCWGGRIFERSGFV